MTAALGIAQYHMDVSNIAKKGEDWISKDTFLDAYHLKESFPDYQVCFTNSDGTENSDQRPPFRISLPKKLESGTLALLGNKQ
ncbi:Intron-binding protein aquarius, N-terminal [Trema orientale]|uniref:Intron-binding protein aquarius, N-terminal n=1 Tax=Trema orientale TaxID=63057 RepID=A0A2P5EH10_TREOI|nr:Intron-binding protein aquarius, N-terminal [Trema orientale]